MALRLTTKFIGCFPFLLSFLDTFLLRFHDTQLARDACYALDTDLLLSPCEMAQIRLTTLGSEWLPSFPCMACKSRFSEAGLYSFLQYLFSVGSLDLVFRSLYFLPLVMCGNGVSLLLCIGTVFEVKVNGLYFLSYLATFHFHLSTRNNLG